LGELRGSIDSRNGSSENKTTNKKKERFLIQLKKESTQEKNFNSKNTTFVKKN
jgi:hypothetical protein